jgi:hypothetical protein
MNNVEENSHWKIRMHARILQILPYPLQQRFHLLHRPPQPLLLLRSRQQRKAYPRRTVRNVLIVPLPNHFMPPVLGPMICRPLVNVLHHIHKASFFELLLVVDS